MNISFAHSKFVIPSAARNLLFLLAVSCCAFAQDIDQKKEVYENFPRGVLVREATIYLLPDTNSTKLGTVTRGREVGIFEQSKEYIKVLAPVTNERDVTGWILDKGVIRKTTPNGDVILFGEASDSENEASKRHGRRGADQDARRLYYRTQEYFPKSPMAGEALWRSADIQWQLEKEGVMSRPSAREMDPTMRGKMEEDLMNQVEKKFPGTKWADMAAFEKIDNKLCGDWKALAKCPEKESEIYEEYVKKHPQSPKAAEALYEAAWRQAALIDIYRGNNENAKIEGAKAKAIALTKQIETQYGQQ